MSKVIGSLNAFLVILNTVFWCTALYVVAITKRLVPSGQIKIRCSELMVRMANSWIILNSQQIERFHKIDWQISETLVQPLSTKRSYLVICNHRSWVDIVVLQHVLNGRIPFLRFFLKRQLIYVPFLGLAWWALDFPFMKRFSKAELEKHPEKRGQDMATTKQACLKLRGQAVSILNFLEGTRFNFQKRQHQQSPFEHLLKPKVGGVGFVLEAMGSQFQSVIDISIYYEQEHVSLWTLLKGELKSVRVHIREFELPKNFIGKEYLADESYRNKLGSWLNDIWAEKDHWLKKQAST